MIMCNIIPESVTKSVVLRPWTRNEALSWSNVEKGPGRFWFARVMFAVKLSLLPNGIGHEGPPPCSYIDQYILDEFKMDIWEGKILSDHIKFELWFLF